jgi:ferric-chelate reductase
MPFSLSYTAHDIPENPLIPFVIKGFSNRSGLLTFASLPFNILLACRINLISFLTGVPPDRLQYLHRWVGRSTLALAILHSSAKLSQSTQFDDMTFRNYGLGAFCVAGLVLVFSHRFSMQYFYEAFANLHNLMIAVLIVLAWKHQPKHKQYLIVSLCIWGLDRVVRYARIIFYNGLWRIGRCRASSSAALRLLSSDTTRLELYKADFPDWQPGSYAYISTPTLSWLPQSHPFTIASRPKRHSKEVIDYDAPGTATSSSALQKDKENVMVPSPNLIFLIRARTGWTRKLHELAEKETYPHIPIIVDGPYGGCAPLHIGFDTVLLFAGGYSTLRRARLLLNDFRF